MTYPAREYIRNARRRGNPHLSNDVTVVIEGTKPYITVTQGGAGWFAVHMWHNPDMGGFWEPYTTGIGRYADKLSAVDEAEDWAEAEGLEYRS